MDGVGGEIKQEKRSLECIELRDSGSEEEGRRSHMISLVTLQRVGKLAAFRRSFSSIYTSYLQSGC